MPGHGAAGDGNGEGEESGAAEEEAELLQGALREQGRVRALLPLLCGWVTGRV